jgi:hypothetical protein
MSQTRPCVECHEPDLSDSGLVRLAAGLLLARTCVGEPKPDSRIYTTTNTDSASFVTKEEPDDFGGLVVSMLASGSRFRGFEPDRSRWIFSDVKKSSPCLPSERK